jgi:CRISPR-associated protein Csb1
MVAMDLVDRLVTAVGEDRRDAGLVFRASYQPVGGPGGRVMPPTFPDPKAPPKSLPTYLLEPRWCDGARRDAVVMDRVPSQANRVEEALRRAHETGRVALPMFELTVPADVATVRLTSLDFPHRYADAYLRDSQIDRR